MTKNEFSKEIGQLRIKYQKSINNIFIWHSVVIETLVKTQKNEGFINQTKYVVASKDTKTKIIERKPEDIRKILNDAVSFESYYSVFVYVVAQVEAFFYDYLKLQLQMDIRRLKIRIQGINHNQKIDVDAIIDASSKEELIDEIIKNELYCVFYASPKLQMEYLNKIAGISVPEDIYNSWIEIKASRDIIIHNQGYINDLYLNKVKELARGIEGEKITIDKDYFEKSIGIMKSIIGKICSLTQKETKSI